MIPDIMLFVIGVLVTIVVGSAVWLVGLRDPEEPPG